MNTHDTQGREYARLSQLKDRSVITSDGNDACMPTDKRYIVFDDGDGKLYTQCKCGRHFLDGHRLMNKDEDYLIGLYNAETAKSEESKDVDSSTKG